MVISSHTTKKLTIKPPRVGGITQRYSLCVIAGEKRESLTPRYYSVLIILIINLSLISLDPLRSWTKNPIQEKSMIIYTILPIIEPYIILLRPRS